MHRPNWFGRRLKRAFPTRLRLPMKFRTVGHHLRVPDTGWEWHIASRLRLSFRNG